MRNSLSQTQESDTRVDAADESRQLTRKAVYQCLIVSRCNERSEMLGQSALEVGWDLIVYDDAERAARQATRERIHLAIIDLVTSGKDPPAGFCELSEMLAARDGPLLVICGHEGDALEEIWARQLGVWLYLPGVNEGSDIVLLCNEARTVVDKRDRQPVSGQLASDDRTRSR